MTLQQLSKTVDFVQATTPSNANDGETWLDTSQSPPQLKVFDSSANAFVRPRSIQNLDAPVSNAGATQSDIETAVDNSSTASTVSTNLDAKVSNAGSGVDWASKSIQFFGGAAEDSTITSVSGAGYILNLEASDAAQNTQNFNVKVELSVDGTFVIDPSLRTADGAVRFTQSGGDFTYNNARFHFSGPLRFDSSFEVASVFGGAEIAAHGAYVLD